MTPRHTVVVADQIDADGLAPLADDPRFSLVHRPGLTGDALAQAIADADAVLVRSATKITRESLARADRLKVIGRAGVGVDTIDVEAATERGIAVLTAPSGNTTSAAELTLALILALVRRIPAADRSMKEGAWDRKRFNGTELRGKTLGLVGAGRVGSEVARRARAFGVRVVAFDPFLTPDRARSLEVELAELDDVLREADILSLHVPLTDATAGLISAEKLALVKPGAFIVNVARGGVLDEQALATALAEGRIAGAALDVFETEPLPRDHPLRSVENAVLTPHLGASTAEAQRSVAVEIAESVRAALVDGDLSRAVNAPALGGAEMRRLRPLLGLVERLGILGAALADGAVAAVELRYSGAVENALGPLAASAMIGVLTPALGRATINLVNALHVAKRRGIAVDRVRSDATPGFGEHVELRLRTATRTVRVAGALLGEGHPRITGIDDYRVDLVPQGTIVVLRNRDVPGVIGRVGTVLGDAKLNIAEYHQARHDAGGDALAVVSVDGRLATTVVDALRRIPEVVEVRQAELP